MENTKKYPLPEKPVVRPELQAFPVKVEEGEEAFLVEDPLRIASPNIVVPSHAAAVMQFFDGSRTIKDVQAELMRLSEGTLIPIEEIESLITQLDEAYLLASDRFEDLVENYMAAPVREPQFAGLAYPEKPDDLKVFLDSAYMLKDAPQDKKVSGDGDDLVAFIAPHIDPQIAQESYAWAYQAVKDNPPADLYIILGVAHLSARSQLGEYIPLLLTKKDFETPLGTFKTDTEFVDKLAKNLSFDPYIGELIHRQEHSVEFQAVWLAHALGKTDGVKIVAGLVSGFHDQVDNQKEPESDFLAQNMLSALRSAIQEYPGKVCVISGADLAHVGTKFDDEPALDGKTPQRIEKCDREMLKSLEEVDEKSFYNYIKDEKNGRHVCGFGSIYTTLNVVKPSRGTLLAYDQSHEEPTQSLVSYTSMAFFGKAGE